MLGGRRSLAQLIKLKDYVSRYEQNILLYPTRFIRLKKQKWDGLKKAFSTNSIENFDVVETKDDWSEEEKRSLIGKVKMFIGKKKELEQNVEQTMNVLEEEKEEGLDFRFRSNQYNHPQTIDELKIQFLNQLYPFQLKWASSTLTEKSNVKRSFYYDERLKYYLQRFPDNYLVLFQPVFQLKKAPVELDTIMITPTEVWCIHLLEDDEGVVFIGSKDKFWIRKKNTSEKKVLSPVISLNRTEQIVKGILEKQEITLPVHKVVLTRNGYIDFPTAPYDLKIVEKRNYEDWFTKMRKIQTPIKTIQLKAAESLLQYCLTISMRRYEWETLNEE